MHVAVVINTMLPDAVQAAAQVQAHLAKRGASVQIIDSVESAAASKGPDRIVALGGDGTLLWAFHLFEHALAPIIGINFGKLGFLSGAISTDLIDALDYALTDEANKEARALLEVIIEIEGQTEPIRVTALNEVMVGRGANAKVVATSLAINGHAIYSIRGDGLIVATATGSTAYALSAGGPIVSPGYDGMVIVPLASHTLVARAMITAADDVVSITLPEEFRSDIMVVVDGQPLELPDAKIGAIKIKPSAQKLELIKLDSRLFYDTVAQNFFSGL